MSFDQRKGRQMRRSILLTIAVVASAAAGCGDDTGGTGGWTGSTLTIVGDECDFFAADEPLNVDITIEGSTVTMVDTDPQSTLTASTDDYSPTDDSVLLTGKVVNDKFPPCKVSLEDAFTLELDDPDLSLDENQTLQVTWNHVEVDESDTPGDCVGEWFVDLPCSGEATFTFTKEAP